MLIIADENIPAVRQAFSTFGEVRTLYGRHMTAEDVCDAEVLLVRSITRVDEKLLAGSRVKFVGSATIGTDHVDLDWLQSRQITFENAPGCNAVSAAEYVLSALLRVSFQKAIDLKGKTVGIIGCGNVGSRVMERMQALGLNCLVCDPPRAEREGKAGFVTLKEIAQADIVTVHVPLVGRGKHATRNLISQDFIQSMTPDGLFINTSRGDVVDEAALKRKIEQHEFYTVILDVWGNEPLIDTALVSMAEIATPHIAGYSIDGKLRATAMLHKALSGYHNKPLVWQEDSMMPPPKTPNISLTQSASVIQLAEQCMTHAYDIRRDDASLRAILKLPDEERGVKFDQLRKAYPVRRECAAYRVDKKFLNNEQAEVLSRLGFR